jgi:hypothetical protein
VFAIEFAISVAAVPIFGINAYAIAVGIALIATLPPILRKLSQKVKFEILSNVLPQIVSGVIAGGVAYSVSRYMGGVGGLLVGLGLAMITFLLVLAILRGDTMAREFTALLGALAPKNQRLARAANSAARLFTALHILRR